MTSAEELDVLHHQDIIFGKLGYISSPVAVLASWSVDIGCPLTSDPSDRHTRARTRVRMCVANTLKQTHS